MTKEQLYDKIMVIVEQNETSREYIEIWSKFYRDLLEKDEFKIKNSIKYTVHNDMINRYMVLTKSELREFDITDTDDKNIICKTKNLYLVRE